MKSSHCHIVNRLQTINESWQSEELVQMIVNNGGTDPVKLARGLEILPVDTLKQIYKLVTEKEYGPKIISHES